jgi:soluble lytic murein transglycosylase
MRKILILLPFLLLLCSFARADEAALYQEMVRHLESGNDSEALRVIEQMKADHPESYESLPYVLLHAKLLLRTNHFKESSALYASVAKDSRWAPFSLLPLARIAAQQGNNHEAINYYLEYLRNKNYPDYSYIAREALDFATTTGVPDWLRLMGQIAERNSSTTRTGQFYIAKSYSLAGQPELARTLYLKLLQASVRDDITSLALSEMDKIDGSTLSDSERLRRGELAYDVWNFPLTRKYLEPFATRDMKAAYYYARALYFLGDVEESKRAFQVAIGLWPDDPLVPQSLYHYANLCLRHGDYERAEQLLRRLLNEPRYREDSVYKLVQLLQAVSRRAEAIQLIEPYCASKDRYDRAKALFVRARLYFQEAKYEQALADLDRATASAYLNAREISTWKAVVLERLERQSEATAILQDLSRTPDFYGIQALQKLNIRNSSASQEPQTVILQLPVFEQREEIRNKFLAGDRLPAFLYLRLFEEAAELLPQVSESTWTLLNVDTNDRKARYLGIAYLAALGNDYPKALYYSEIFLKNLGSNGSFWLLPLEVQKVLFPFPFRTEVERYAKERGVDPLLVAAIMRQESRFKVYARSRSFARGLMQLIPTTANRMAVSAGLENFQAEQLYQPDVNINLGTKYIQEISSQFGDAAEVIAAAYNGGESNLKRWLACSLKGDFLDFFSNIDMKETKNYVAIVKTNYELYKRVYAR